MSGEHYHSKYTFHILIILLVLVVFVADTNVSSHRTHRVSLRGRFIIEMIQTPVLSFKMVSRFSTHLECFFCVSM